MKFEGKEFDGSDSIFKTNRLLQSDIGTGIWLTVSFLKIMIVEISLNCCYQNYI